MRRILLGLLLACATAEPARAQHSERYDAAFRRYTKRYFGIGFDWHWFKAQAMAESDLEPGARSPVGARGLMQLMPSTFQAIATTRPTFTSIDDPEWNIAAGILHDRDLWRLWENAIPEPRRPNYMFAAYNAGEGPITRAAAMARARQLDHTVWPSIEAVAPAVPRWRYRETLGYVRKIESNYGRLSTPPALAADVPRTAASASQPAIWKERVEFKSGKLTLVGYLFRPAGPGPFKGLIWNHGSEKSPGTGRQYDSVAAVFGPAGYVVFAPMRRGHGDSEGAYVVDETQRERQAHGADAANRLVVRLLETEQLDDQLAGLTYLKSLSYVDTTRLVVAGCSYGGIQTLLGAERGAGYKAAVSISPAGLSWNGSPVLQDRLKKAARGINIPVFLLQPPKDTSLEPSRVLGAEFERLHKQYKGKIYPTTIPEDLQVHCFGGAKGDHIWAADVLAFLSEKVP